MRETATGTRPDEACTARRGDDICVWVYHLEAWLNDPDVKDRLPKDAKIEDLVPFINDVPLKGIHPEQSWADPRRIRRPTRKSIISDSPWIGPKPPSQPGPTF